MQRDGAILAGLAAALAIAGATVAAPPPGVVVPNDNDDYSRLVARAEADQNVDFHALRFAWLDSAARTRATAIDQLSRDMTAAAEARDNARVRRVAEQILSIDYTDMLAHKYRRGACHLLGDTQCEQHEHFVEFGLLTSITEGKDGKSQATAWEVASVNEEHFMLAMAGLAPGTQFLVNDHGRAFDRFDATDESGSRREIYFDITVMLLKEFPGLK